MENKNIQQETHSSEEKPLDVLVKIILSTVVTCFLGWLIMYLGLI
ncbi:MAG: hypothetical protein PHV05_01880 [Candidatus Riflebacteria bacterium]|nr:hypothetical protein [Candidatus Riflebacteria bacterium]